jgi:hypothetical protein
MATKWQRVRIPIPKGLTPEQREVVADEIIAHITERTQAGQGFRESTGRQFTFPGYTKEYAKRKGVSRGSVDLTLDADMLAAIELLSHSPDSLLIGYERGSEENAKADGNARGTYGRQSPIRGKARPFLGLQRQVLNEIVRRVRGSE